METVRKFAYFGDRVIACGECEAAVTARIRCGWVKFRECGVLLYGRCPLRQKGDVYRSYVRPAILYRSEAWCLKESEMGTLRRTESSMVRAMCGVQLKDRKRSIDLMFMLGLNKTMDQLAMASSFRWYGHVLWRKDGHILRMALDFEVEGRRTKGRLRRTWTKQVGGKSVKVGLKKEDVLCRLKLSAGVNQIAAELRLIWPPSHVADTT